MFFAVGCVGQYGVVGLQMIIIVVLALLSSRWHTRCCQPLPRPGASVASAISQLRVAGHHRQHDIDDI